MTNDFKFCPMCGSKNIKSVKRAGADLSVPSNEITTLKWNCPDCGFDLYCNVAAAVGIVISDSENNVLFEVRAKEPKKGFIVIPGGFVDADETAEEAAIRECREEIGFELPVENIKYLATFPNTYEYKNILYKTCDVFFSAKLPRDITIPKLMEKLHAEKSEVTAFQIHKIETAEDVEKLPIAFPSGANAVKAYIAKNTN